MTALLQEPQAKASSQTSGNTNPQTSINAAPASLKQVPTVKATIQNNAKLKSWLFATIAVVSAAIAAYVAWPKFQKPEVPEGFAETHGRIEATKLYISPKAMLRVDEILAKEGDTVEAGQVVARMDTRTLQAQLNQALAQTQRAMDAKISLLAQVAERDTELELARTQLVRSQKLLVKGGASQQQVDVDVAKWKTSGSALQSARSQVTGAQSAIEAAQADADRLRVDVEDGVLKAPRHGRIQYRLAEVGEVLPPGGRVLDMIDLTDVYMLFYLPEAEAGKTTIGAEARLILDALPDVVVPATVYFVAAEAQFTPKSVETRTERQKLAFQVRARIDANLLRKYESYVKTGLPGVVYVRLDPKAEWPERLRVRLPETVTQL